MDEMAEIPTDLENIKLHLAGRSRKRRQLASESSDGDLDDVLPSSHAVKRKKHRRLASSSDEAEEDDELEDRNFNCDPNAVENSSKVSASTAVGSSPNNGHPSTSAYKEEPDADCQIVEGYDPWAHLEEALAKLTKEYPSLDPLVIQDALIQNEVNLKEARKTLTAMVAPVTVGNHSSPLHPHHDQPRKKIVFEPIDTTDKTKYHMINDHVYDSDDESDNEDETEDRKIISQFLQEASLPELLKIRGLSERKANLLVEARPFSNWKQFISAIKSKRYLNLDSIVDATKDFLNARTTVSKIIRRCQILADRVENAIALHADDIIEPPKMLAKGMKLQGYQLLALQWLSVLHKSKMNGILADEMGLGKTIQSIAFIAYLLEHGVKGPFLVIAPASTIDNWDDEFRRWTPSIRTVVYHGSLEDRAFLRQEFFSPAGLQKMEVVITTYHGATRNIIDKAAFKRLKFDFAIYDEAHLLKNMTSQKYRSLMSTIHASGRLLLTGTPVQNNLTELLSLLVFAMPEMLSKEISSLEHAFTYISNQGSSKYEMEQVREARAILKPFILRRTKEDVALELPGKVSKMERVSMSKKQQAMYDSMVKRYAGDEEMEDADNEVGSAGLEALHQLRKLANHPVLVRHIFTKAILPELAADLIRYHPQYKKDTTKHLAIDLEFMSDFQLHQLCMVDRNMKKYRLKPEALVDSGKLEYLDEMLPIFKEEERRVLLFSQYVQVLDVIESYLGIRKHPFARIDGQTPVGERQDIVDRFNTDPTIFIMLLSTRAGGLGINLTGADTVIIHDIDYNPYNDKQAENRCHRLGQKREVTVYRLISRGTIEEGMYEMGQKKLQLEKNVMEAGPEEIMEKAAQDEEALDVEAAKALLHSSLSKSHHDAK